jgi:hypothetical protein
MYRKNDQSFVFQELEVLGIENKCSFDETRGEGPYWLYILKKKLKKSPVCSVSRTRGSRTENKCCNHKSQMFKLSKPGGGTPIAFSLIVFQ